eukprot:m.31791 g.31791  ORF g.31791 m.31791 type:complete len:404 (+) comp12549_c0_seq1:259-1470(+)
MERWISARLAHELQFEQPEDAAQLARHAASLSEAEREEYLRELLPAAGGDLAAAIQQKFFTAKDRILMLGVGSSTCTPSLSCLSWDRTKECKVCFDAVQNPESRNRRNNVSMLITFTDHLQNEKHILIDCGKTFRLAVERFFPKFHIDGLDALVLTHEHADAFLGIDDLRDVQRCGIVMQDGIEQKQPLNPLPIFCSQYVLQQAEKTFPYLMPRKPQSEEEARANPKRYVALLEWNAIAESKGSESVVPDTASIAQCRTPFNVQGLLFHPLPVYHGGEYVSLGFAFKLQDDAGFFVYLSDMSAFLPETEARLKAMKIHTLILDCLFIERAHNTHINLPQAKDIVRMLKPRHTYFVGMTHEFDYYEENPKIVNEMAKEGLHVELAYDGLCLEHSFRFELEPLEI